MRSNYICAVDIGESKIAACVVKASRKGEITELDLESVPSKGLERGMVLNSTDLSSCISFVLSKLREKTGIKIKDVYLSITGTQIITKHSNAIIPLSERGNKIITYADIKSVNEQARILGSSLDEEIIHQIPFSYTIDGINKVLDPNGLYGHKLEVDLFLVCVRLSFAQSLLRAVNQAGYEVKEMMLSGLANSEVVFDKNLDRGLNVICDIGADTTEIVVFNSGVLQTLEVIPMGGNDITRALARDMDIPFELANSIKESHAAVLLDTTQISGDKEVMLKKGTIYKPVSQKLIYEIVTREANLIYDAIKIKLSKILPHRKIDAFVVLGRTVLLDGFLETMESVIGVQIRLARILNTNLAHQINKDFATSSMKTLTCLNSLGLIQRVINASKSTLSAEGIRLTPVSRVIAKAKEVYQEYF